MCTARETYNHNLSTLAGAGHVIVYVICVMHDFGNRIRPKVLLLLDTVVIKQLYEAEPAHRPLDEAGFSGLRVEQDFRVHNWDTVGVEEDNLFKGGV
jgi:hypothetical protein